MDQFRSFDQLRTGELSVIRHGFFRPWFELTDGQFSYGKFSYVNLWKTSSILAAAHNTWIIKRKGVFSRSLLINDTNDMEIGTITPELWSPKIMLSMNDGFEAVYLKKKVFTHTFTLTNTQYGDMMNIKTELLGFKTPFKVSVDLNQLKNVPNLPLLALLGINLILLKQERAAASAGVGG